MDDAHRLVSLERRTRELEGRLATVERVLTPRPNTTNAAKPPPKPRPEQPVEAPRPTRPAPRAPTPKPSAATPATRRPAPAESLEDLLGGRVLAWVGGIATLLGIVFLFSMAVSNGWVGEGARTLLGGFASAGLVCLGVWLHPRKGRTEAALAAAASGIAGLFVTATVAAQVYDLIPAALAVGATLGIGAFATGLAVSWRAQPIAALGIIGALLAPVLAGTSLAGSEVWVLWAAFLSAAGVLVWQRWDWLAVAAFLVATPQWTVWLAETTDAAAALAVLMAFGVVGAVAAVGFELRRAGTALSRTSATLTAVNALVLAAAGWLTFSTLEEPTLANGWLVALAVVHVLAGVLGRRSARVSSPLALLSLTVGVVLADLAFEAIAGGAALSLGFAASVTAFAVLRRRATGNDAMLIEGGLALHLALAIAHVMVNDAPPSLLTGGEGELAPAGLALLAVAGACLASAYALRESASDWQLTLNGIAAATVAYLAAVSLDGAALVTAWSLEAVVLALIWRRSQEPVAAWAALGNLGLALGHLVSIEATPDALVYGLDEPTAAALAGLGACAAAAALAWVTPPADQTRSWLAGTAAVTALYVLSALVVTPFQPGAAGVVDGALLELGVRQQGQAVLSGVWALAGTVALFIGLRRDIRGLRMGALALLLLTVGKVFLVDLATLESVYRVISFIALGLLLLGSAFVWQRLRPRPLEDLRDVPQTLR